MIFWGEKEAKWFLEELPFYNAFIEKPNIKRLNNIDFLCKLPFYDELNVVKTQKHLEDM